MFQKHVQAQHMFLTKETRDACVTVVVIIVSKTITAGYNWLQTENTQYVADNATQNIHQLALWLKDEVFITQLYTFFVISLYILE